MCAYSNGFCSGHPLANQVPSELALSHKLETDVLGRAESVDIVNPGFFDVSLYTSTGRALTSLSI